MDKVPFIIYGRGGGGVEILPGQRGQNNIMLTGQSLNLNIH